MKCPRCLDTKVRYSFKTPLERVLTAVIPISPLRCRSCRHRFWRLDRPVLSPVRGLALGLLTSVLVLVAIWAAGVVHGVLEASTVEDGTLKDGTLKDGTLKDGTLKDGTLKDGAFEDTVLEDSALEDSVLEDLAIKNVPPAAAASKDGAPAAEERPAVGDTAGLEEARIAILEDLGMEDEGEGAATQSPPPGAPREVAAPKESGSPDKANSKAKADSPAKTGERRIQRLRAVERDGGLDIEVKAGEALKDFRSFFIESPRRLVVDLPGAWSPSVPKDLAMSHYLAHGVRIGRHGDRLRLVVDLMADAQSVPRVRATDDGLIIEIEPVSLRPLPQ